MPFNDAVRARIRKERADAAFFIVDQQNLRRAGKNLHDFADDAVRSNHAPCSAECGRARRD